MPVRCCQRQEKLYRHETVAYVTVYLLLFILSQDLKFN